MSAETLDLARWQFALTAGAHFLFVALTLGLATCVAVMQTVATASRSPLYERMVRFWGQLYVINYAMGIVTGLLMEFQLGLNWSGLTEFAGGVFGAPVAMETIIAFFIESTFLGLWIFGWNRLNRWVHLSLIWVVTLTAYFSAYFIMVANGFLNNPVAYREVNGHLQLTDLATLMGNPNALVGLGHIAGASMVTAGFFLAGISAYHLRRRTQEFHLFRKSLRVGVFITLPALFWTVTFGGFSFEVTPRFHDEPSLAKGTTYAATGDGTMMGLWALMTLIAMISIVFAAIPVAVYRFRPWHWLLMLSIPLPFLAVVAGWMFREGGRQPWAIYGLLKTEDAVSPISGTAMTASMIIFTVLFGVLSVINYLVLARSARRGPDGAAIGRPEPAPEPVPAPAL